MEALLPVIFLIVLLAFWLISMQRSLIILDAHVSNTMRQIGIQLASRSDALFSLLDLARIYAAEEAQVLFESIGGHSAITASSTPSEVLYQAGVISETLDQVASLAARCPALRENPDYAKYRTAADSYETMLRTSRLIYNDAALKFNQATGKFPANLAAWILGFRPRAYFSPAPDLPAKARRSELA